MKIIGLTGGIGSGKSTVSDYLAKKGYPIIDADKIAKNIVLPESELLGKLSNCFGKRILNGDGSLNRSVLAEIIFSDKNQKLKLDNIMLKEIIKNIWEQVSFYEKEKVNTIFIDAPLLFETRIDSGCNETWVVDTNDEIRIQRVVKRDGISKKDVLARINSQMSRAEKNKKASFILDNSKSEEDLYIQIEKLLD